MEANHAASVSIAVRLLWISMLEITEEVIGSPHLPDFWVQPRLGSSELNDSTKSKAPFFSLEKNQAL